MDELQQIPYSNNAKKKNKAPDNMFIGILIGILFPSIGIIIMYFLWGHGNPQSFFTMFFETKNYFRIDKASKVLSLSMITNLLPFYYFLNRKKYLTARGILFAMFIYGVIIAIYKFVLQ